MNDEELDRLIDEALEIPIPEGLSDRLEMHINALATNENKRKHRLRFIYWMSSAAAIALLCIGIFIGTGSQSPQHQTADTFTNPEEAAIAAQQALAFLSTQLNKGMEQVENAGHKFEKVNHILNKHLKN
ncbi:MAG: DUF3379 domain-containing protein [Tannerellaceae bacterium]|jgi:hypothetical protein|nr:DUF3379 domain-containing protein [Tannerellaceae bacterium]